ncbi:hypothetical protein J2X36_004870 [Methylobacterium sp. BE186]|nr:hypothetical protein [Methylobacterium sp. BE186]
MDNDMSVEPAGQTDSGPGDRGRTDPGEAAFLDLHRRREALERNLALVQVRLRCAPDAAEANRAKADEGGLLRDLDQVLTLIRAAEYRRRPGARQW